MAPIGGGARISLVLDSLGGKHLGVLRSVSSLFKYIGGNGIFDHMIGHVVFVPFVWYAERIRGFRKWNVEKNSMSNFLLIQHLAVWIARFMRIIF